MELHLRRARARHQELEQLLQDPKVIADRARLVLLSREYQELQTALRLYDELTAIERAQHHTRELLRTSADNELRRLAETELSSLTERASMLGEKIRDIIDPPDVHDRKDIVVEIRAGAGGDEAALFAADLFRMYLRYAERKGWKSQLVSQSRTPLGGYKEVIFELSGGPVYRDLKFESGVHRVQRIPETEKSGRVHTSTTTVVVLPEADEIEVTIDPKDVEVTATTSTGHGGQSVNTTYSAIRLVHIPTGIVVSCQDERSQLQNREKAMRILRARLFDLREKEQKQEASAQRKSLIGSGDRSEKIRTYNVPQDRVTDHRIKQSFHGLERILQGELDPLITQMRAADRAQRTNETHQ